MHPLEKETLKVIRKKKLVALGDTVVVGVSGGPDSIALLYVLAKLAGELNFKLVAAYLDHGLRPYESGKEKDFVRLVISELGGSFEHNTVDVKSFASSGKLSIEDAARQLGMTISRRF
jgi:tRNA(Ile)-lysidine synthase